MEHLEGKPFDPVPLEAGVTWHIWPSEEHKALMGKYFDFYKEFVAKSDADNLAGADTILVGDPRPVGEGMPPFVACFVIAASLHLGTRIRSQMLRFDEATGEMQPHSGFPIQEASGGLRSGQEPIRESTCYEIAET